MKTKICLKCNKEFNKPITCSKKKWGERMYCSNSCANSVNSTGTKRCLGNIPWNKGKKLGRYLKNTCIKKNCLICDKEFIVKNYRKDIAKYCCKRCSEIARDEGKSTKNKRIRQSIEYRLWREAVFARDNWTCQKYKIKGGKLHPHHILNFAEYPELRFAIDNGITLSRKAHLEFHKEYGFRNNTKKQINECVATSQEE